MALQIEKVPSAPVEDIHIARQELCRIGESLVLANAVAKKIGQKAYVETYKNHSAYLANLPLETAMKRAADDLEEHPHRFTNPACYHNESLAIIIASRDFLHANLVCSRCFKPHAAGGGDAVYCCACGKGCGHA